MFTNMKISRRLWIVMATMMVFLLSLGGIGIYEMNAIEKQLERIVNVNLKRQQSANDLRQSILRSLTSIELLPLLADIDQRRKESEIFAKHRKEYDAAEQEIEALVAVSVDAETKQIWSDIKAMKAATRPVNSRVIELSLQDRNEEAIQLYLTESRSLNGKWEESIGTFIEQNKKRTEFRYQEARSSYRTALILMGVVTVAALALGGTIFLILIRSIINPLRLGIDRIRDLAEGEGDLTKRFNFAAMDEIGELGGWLDRFISRIHDNVVDIRTGAATVVQSTRKVIEAGESISAAAEEVFRQAQAISAAATQMNQNMGVVTSSVEEMSISVAEVAKRSAGAADISARANKAAVESDHRMKELGGNAAEIGSVTDSIAQIASQTNLLALNAAIEAAGAGDAGKGFAVVASEVKELARQAAESSDTIKTRIEAMQTSSDQAVGSINEIVTLIGQVNQIASSIAASVEEQSITSKEIAGNIAQTAQATGEVVSNISGISTAAKGVTEDMARSIKLNDEMQQQAQAVFEIVNRFKTNHGTG